MHGTYILDGCSDLGAYIWSKSGILIWWRHLVTLTESSIFSEKTYLTSWARNMFWATILCKHHGKHGTCKNAMQSQMCSQGPWVVIAGYIYKLYFMYLLLRNIYILNWTNVFLKLPTPYIPKLYIIFIGKGISIEITHHTYINKLCK